MPYDDAIAATSTVAGGEFIWAVYGARIFKINPSTGERISTAVIDTRRFQSCITYDPTNDILYVMGYAVQWSESTIIFTNNYPCNLYAVNPNTLAITGTTNLTLDAGMSTGYDSTTGGCIGVNRMFWDDSNQMLLGSWHFNQFGNPFRWKPSAPFIRGIGNVIARNNSFADSDWNGVDRLFWSNIHFQEVAVFDSVTDGFGWSPDATYDMWADDTTIPFGIAVVPPSDFDDQNFFVATQTGFIKRLSYNESTSTISLVTNINTGLSGVMFRLIYNPYDGLIYGPMPSQSKVVILNPNDNSFTVHATTFDLPWSMVFTAGNAKKWVVQQGAVGLKELT